MLDTMMTGAVRLRLDEILNKTGMTNRDFAKKTGLSENAISNLKRNATAIRFDTLETLCRTLNVEPGDLLVFDKDVEQ